MLEYFKVKKLKFFDDVNKKNDVIHMMKTENAYSLLSKMPEGIINKYFEIVFSSNKLSLFVCFFKDELIGYALLANKPSYLVSEFKSLTTSIFFHLIGKMKLTLLFDIILAVLKIDTLKINKENKKLLNESLNLNLLAIRKNYQSKGFGKLFLMNIIDELKKEKKFKFICCETYSSDAENFYVNKLGFNNIGEKTRFAGKLKVLKKKINYS